jgi:hypothetical protein
VVERLDDDSPSFNSKVNFGGAMHPKLLRSSCYDPKSVKYKYAYLNDVM